MEDDQATTTAKSTERRRGKTPVRVEESDKDSKQAEVTKSKSKPNSDNAALLEMLKSMNDNLNKKLDEQKLNNDELNKKLDEQKQNHDVLSKKLDDYNDNLDKKLDDHKREINNSLNKKLDDNNKVMNANFDRRVNDLKQEIVSNNERLENKIVELQLASEKQAEKTSQGIDEARLEIEQFKNNVTTQVKEIENKCTRNSDNLEQKLTEQMLRREEELEDRLITIDVEIKQIEGQAVDNKEEIEKMKQQEIVDIRKELEEIRNRATPIINYHTKDNSELLNFREYKRNPIEFLNRFEEIINRNKENRWGNIRSMLDECFKQVNDNWWTAIRHNISNFQDFKTCFRNKYWSEAIQHIVRDDICYGKFNDKLGVKPTTYFLGKVCLAKNLEPNIPEECLVAKMAYHFDETVPRARLTGQVKTITGMEELLGDYEREEYYRKGRKTQDYYKERHNENKPRVNHIRSEEPRDNTERNDDSRFRANNNQAPGYWNNYNHNRTRGNYNNRGNTRYQRPRNGDHTDYQPRRRSFDDRDRYDSTFTSRIFHSREEAARNNEDHVNREQRPYRRETTEVNTPVTENRNVRENWPQQ